MGSGTGSLVLRVTNADAHSFLLAKRNRGFFKKPRFLFYVAYYLFTLFLLDFRPGVSQGHSAIEDQSTFF
jgi:hypothetical protein